MKVLICDSDWRFAQRAGRFLESHAHLVVTHTHAAKLAETVHHWQPDLLIVAAEFVEAGALDALAEADNPPAVLLVEYMDRYDRAWRAWQTAGDELILKPVLRREEFHQAVVAALENAAAGFRRPAAVAAGA